MVYEADSHEKRNEVRMLFSEHKDDVPYNAFNLDEVGSLTNQTHEPIPQHYDRNALRRCPNTS